MSRWYGRAASEFNSTVIPSLLSPLAPTRCGRGSDCSASPPPPNEQLLSEAAIVSMLGAVIAEGEAHSRCQRRERERERKAV